MDRQLWPATSPGGARGKASVLLALSAVSSVTISCGGSSSTSPLPPDVSLALSSTSVSAQVGTESFAGGCGTHLLTHDDEAQQRAAHPDHLRDRYQQHMAIGGSSSERSELGNKS